MTQPGYRHRIIIQDRSGSMTRILAGAQSGLDEFFTREAQLPGHCTVSLWDFDEEIRCVCSLASVSAAAGYLIVPRGWTALYDAIADAVTAEGEKLAALAEDERPEDVTVIIASDGQENQSQRFKRHEGGGARVKALLDHQQEVYNWRILYLGTNQDAFAEAAAVGISDGSTMSYVNTSTGAQNSWSAASDLLGRAPVGTAAPGRSGFSFTRAERRKGQSASPQPPAQPQGKGDS